MNVKKIISLLLTLTIGISGVAAVAASPGTSLAEVDFSSLSTGFEYNTNYTSDQMMAIYNNDIKNYGTSGLYKLVDEKDYGTSLQVYPSAYNNGGSVVMQFPESVTSGRIEVDVSLKILGSTSLVRHILAPITKSGSTKYALGYTNAFRRNTSNTDTDSSKLHFQPSQEGEGFYHFVCVLTSPDSASKWTYEIYDKTNMERGPFYTQEFLRKTESGNKRFALAEVGGFYLVGDWSTSSTYGNGENGIEINKAVAYKSDVPKITDVGAYNEATKCLTVKFDKDISFEPSNLVVSDQDENKVFTKVTREKADEFTVSFPWGIPSDGKLSLTLENVKYEDSEFGMSYSIDIDGASKDDACLYNAAFTDKNGNEVSDISKLDELNLSFENYGVTDDILYMAAYKSGILQSVNISSITENNNTLNIKLNGEDEVKAFVWKENMTPVFGAVSISGEGVPMPLSVRGDFYTEDDTAAVCISGNDTLYAKARISGGNTYENLIATVNLVRGEIKEQIGSCSVIFNGIVSNVSIPLNVKDLLEGDVLEFVIKDADNEYFVKKLYYNDPKYTIDILLVAGQSNALGQYADKTLSVKPEEGTVYFNTMGNTTLSTTGTEGWSGALGKTWHDRTGHTVLVVKAAWGGTGFELKSSCYGLWSPDATAEDLAQCHSGANNCYNDAKAKYNNAVSSVQSYLDSGYEVGKCVYFWLQGENENKTYSPEQYKDAFMKMHNGFITEFGTENTRLSLCGILPVRLQSSPSIIAESLKITGPRAAQSYLSNARDDIIMASTATENWYSNASIKEWFEAKYPDNSYTNGEMPQSISDVWRSDHVHYNQKVHNELGEEAANSMLDYIEENKECEGISLIGQDGIKHYKDGDEIILPETSVSPLINPTSSAKTAEYTLTGSAAEMSEYNVITAKPAFEGDYSVLTVTLDSGRVMTFKLYSPIVDNSISIASVKDNKAAIYTLTTDDGYKYTNEYLDGKFEELGLVGTMGLITDVLGTDGKLSVADAQALVETGRWGVANHTKAHKQGKFQANTLTEAELEEEINGARNILLGYFPNEKIVGMYTPGGGWSDEIVNKVKENHIVLRRAGGGNNALPITTESMLKLNARAIFSDTALASMNSWIDTAISNRQWVCEMWHGIGDDASSWGGNTTEEIADAHLQYVKQKKDEGKLWVTTLDEAGIYSYQIANTKISKISENDSEIKISVTDELDDAIFDSELTINVTLPEGWTSATVTISGEAVDTDLNDGTLSFNVPHDTGEVSITKTI